MATAQSPEQIIAGYLENTVGLSVAQTAGVLGNLQVESGFDPTSYNPGEKAIGIAQWEGGRRSNGLDVYAAAHHESETDLAAQLGYMSQELAGPFAGALADVKRATTPAQAAAVWDAEYEISAGTTRTERIADAQSIYNQLAGGTLVPGSPAAALGPTGGSVGGGASTIAAKIPGTGLLSDAAKGVLGTVMPFVLKMAFVAGGVTLLVLGAYIAARPARTQAAQLAPLAAAAA